MAHDLPDPPDPEIAARSAAVVIAGHRCQIDDVTAALTDDAALVREAAINALVRIDPRTGRAAVEAALADLDPRVRRRAAELSVPVETDPSSLLDDPDPSVVEVAAFACGEHDWSALDRPAPIESLAKIATGHADALCRESAAAALGAIGDPAGLPAVLTACTDRVTVRRRAVLALAAFEDERADAALQAALTDKDWQVRQAAEDLLEVGRTLESPEEPTAYAD